MGQLEQRYPTYSGPERLADGVCHVISIAAAVTGTVLILIFAALHLSGGQLAALSIYSAGLVGCFIASALYHLTPIERMRPTFRRIDQAAIYIKIAGTYTPLVVIAGTAFAYGVLGVVWGLAVLGAVLRLFTQFGAGRTAFALYLGLGWMSVLLIGVLAKSIPPLALGLVVIGGVLYTIGALLFLRPGRAYETAIWHGFVLLGSGAMFAAIAVGSFSQIG